MGLVRFTRSRRIAALVVLAAALVAALFTAAAGQAVPTCTNTWDGGGGADTSWGNNLNWQGNTTPVGGDVACIPLGVTVTIPSGSFTVNAIVSSGTITMSGGTLTLNGDPGGNSTATVFNISGGTLGGAGNLDLSGTSTWSGGIMDGAGTTTVLSGATLRQQTNSVTAQNGRVIDVQGLFEVGANGGGNTTIFGGGTAPAIHVEANGVLARPATAAAAGVSTINPAIDNDGIVRSDSGTLQLAGGGGTSTGTYGSASAGGTVSFTNGTHTLGGGAAWAGGVTLAGGTLNVASGTATVSGANNNFTNGTLGGTGTFLIASGTLVWSAGIMDGAGTTRVAAGATLRQQVNSVTIQNGRTVDVLGTFEVGANTAGSTTLFAGGTAPLIHVEANAILLRPASAAVAASSTINVAILNDGAIRSDAGTIQLNGGSSGTPSGGQYGTATQAGTIDFRAGTSTLAGGASFAGGVTISGGTVSVPSGTVTASGPGNSMTGGTFTGAGTFLITSSSTFTWSAGTLDAAGTTRVDAGSTLLYQTNSVTIQNGRTVDVLGTFDVGSQTAGNTTVFAGGTAPVIHIEPGGVLIRPTGAAPAATTQINVAVQNDGTVRSDSGTLALNGGSPGTPSTGQYGASGQAGIVRLGGGTHTVGNGARLAGGVGLAGGTLSVFAGTVTVSGTANTLSGGTLGGTGTLDIASGTVAWSGSIMDGAGTTAVDAGATLLQTTNDVTVQNGRVISVAGTFDVGTGTTGNTTIFSGGTAPLVHIQPGGKLVRDGSAAAGAVSTLNPPVMNEGTVESDAGTLDVNGALTNYSGADSSLTGGAFTAKNATLELPGAVHRNAAQLTVSGASALIRASGANALKGLTTNSGGLQVAGDAALTLDGGLTNSGTVGVTDTAVLTTSGDYTQTTAGKLQIGLGGAGAGTFGRLAVTGAAHLAGALDLVTAAGGVPADGTKLPILSFGSRTGSFGTVTGAGLPGGRSYGLSYGPNGLTLTVLAPGAPPSVLATAWQATDSTHAQIVATVSTPAGAGTCSVIYEPQNSWAAHRNFTGAAKTTPAVPCSSAGPATIVVGGLAAGTDYHYGIAVESAGQRTTSTDADSVLSTPPSLAAFLNADVKPGTPAGRLPAVWQATAAPAAGSLLGATGRGGVLPVSKLAGQISGPGGTVGSIDTRGTLISGSGAAIVGHDAPGIVSVGGGKVRLTRPGRPTRTAAAGGVVVVGAGNRIASGAHRLVTVGAGKVAVLDGHGVLLATGPGQVGGGVRAGDLATVGPRKPLATGAGRLAAAGRGAVAALRAGRPTKLDVQLENTLAAGTTTQEIIVPGSVVHAVTGSAGGKPLPVLSGHVRWTRPGAQRVTLRPTSRGAAFLSALARKQADRARKHKAALSVSLTVRTVFQPRHGRAIATTRRLTAKPK